ncbi:unnamed protein product [Schistosoma turkestanicum]|nr:unnamed protein product [Schistosoma turkestanicum]
MSSCEDLFQSFTNKVDISEISSDLFSNSSAKSLQIKKKPKDKPDHVKHCCVGELIPDFSSYEKYELIVESDLGDHQTSSCNKENTTSSDNLPLNSIVKHQIHDIGISSSAAAAFCSTPGSANILPTLNSQKKNVYDLTAPKIVSRDALLNTLQFTPIHPVFNNQKSIMTVNKENNSPPIDSHQQTPTYHDYHHHESSFDQNQLVSSITFVVENLFLFNSIYYIIICKVQPA